MGVIYPDAKVQLVGEDENAFAILSRVSAALKEAGCCRCSIEDSQKKAMSGDYDNLLGVVMLYVCVDDCDCSSESAK
jgi:hypothetical protein